MFTTPESWVWDFWLADDGEQYHLFFLYASRALKDPAARHHRASVGHAVSRDLTTWERTADALVRSDPPAFDDLATWTGSVVRHPDGTWFMFYTGATLNALGANVQSVGYATSTDLLTWDKAPGPVLRADPRWYEQYSPDGWHDEAFRDPWVFADPGGDGWHMLITARAPHGELHDRGVVGAAWSPDLRTWQLRPPLTEPGQGFGQLEVMQTLELDGQHLLLFSCLSEDLSTDHRATGTPGGVWVARADGPLGPYDLANAQLVADRSLYVGRVVTDRDTGLPRFLAFHNEGPHGSFIGEITDPMPLSWSAGQVQLHR